MEKIYVCDIIDSHKANSAQKGVKLRNKLVELQNTVEGVSISFKDIEFFTSYFLDSGIRNYFKYDYNYTFKICFCDLSEFNKKWLRLVISTAFADRKRIQ